MIPSIKQLFDFHQTEHPELFHDAEYPWDVLKMIEEYMQFHFEHNRPTNQAQENNAAFIGEQVSIGEGTIIEPGVIIHGPVVIGKNCVIRSNAYIRENVIVGDNCLVGNSSEVKNSVLFSHVSLPHYNYVGDSILGYKVHLGSGAVISNAKIPLSEITVRTHYKSYKTGLHKFGALIGDFTEIGSNSVINPGSIIGRNCAIYPLTSFRGILPQNSIVKLRQEQEIVKRK